MRMASPMTLNDRVAALEFKVEKILGAHSPTEQPKDWRNSIGRFAGDDLMKEIDREGAKVREASRNANGS